MEQIANISNRGGRVYTPKLRESLENADSFEGLSNGVSRFDLLVLVKRAGKTIGFTAKQIELLDYYMSYTKDCDWEQGGYPIVYQSLSKTALDFCVTERQIQKLEQGLFELGAITWNDSGNHRRYGMRDENGRIIYAYGVNLAPLAFLESKLRNALHEKSLRDQAWMEKKRSISTYRRMILSSVSELEGQGVNVDGFLSEYSALNTKIRTYMGLEVLIGLNEAHMALYRQVTLELTKRTSKCSPKDEQGGVPYKSTKQKQFNKLNTNRAEAQSALQGDVAKSRVGDSKPDPDKRQPLRASLSDKHDLSGNELIFSTGLQHLSLKQVLSASSEEFLSMLPRNGNIQWFNIVDAAYTLKTRLGISQNAWARACESLTRNGAAICIILTDLASKRDQKPVDNTAGYFTAMINRASQGELRLQQSIFKHMTKNMGEISQ